MKHTRTMRWTSALILLATAGSAWGQHDKTFTPDGTVDTWYDDGNWSPNGVPEADESVLIPQGKTCNIPFKADNTAVCKLIDVAGTLVVESTGVLSVDQDLTVKDNASGANGAMTIGGTTTVTLDTVVEPNATLVVNGDLTIDGQMRVESAGSATMDSGGTVTADSINVESGATVVVSGGNPQAVLKISADSTVDGFVDTQGVLTIEANLKITGDGGIIKLGNKGLINGTGNLTIRGVPPHTRDHSLSITGGGTIAASLTNKAYVVADFSAGGTKKELTTNPKDSTSRGHWIAEGNPNSELLVQVNVTGAGAWEITDPSGGKIHIDAVISCNGGPITIEVGTFLLSKTFCTTGEGRIEDVNGAFTGIVLDSLNIQFTMGGACACP